MAESPPPPKTPKPRRARRWIFRLLVLALILVGGYFLVMQSFLTRWIVMSQVGRQVGGQASASSVILSPSGRVVIKDGTLRAPGVPGEAGNVFTVKRLEAEFAWSSLLGGGLAVHRIELEKPLARISQSVDDGTVNLAALSPPKTTTPPKEVPKVIVRGGVIELGEHITDPSKHAGSVPVYAALKSIDVGGEVVESPDETGAKIFSFHEVEGARPVLGGLTVQGRISKEGIALTLEGLSLSTWSAASTPAATRVLFEELAMQGEIPRAVITYSYAGTWEARIKLLNVAINLPLTARPDEDDDGNPLPQTQEDKKRHLRMERVNGEVAFTNKGVRGELKGLMEELPYEVLFTVDGTSMDSPFVCTLESRNFELTKKPQIMKFAPGVARRRLEQFNNPTGKVDAKITVTRGAPVAGKEADIDVAGLIHFREMTSAFERFPYRFYKMTGEVTFDSNRVDLVSIDGQASTGARLHATGVISPPNDAAGVDLEIHVTNIPIDTQLREAMLGRRRVLDALFNEDRYKELLDAGLIATPTQHNDALARLAQLPPDSEDAPRLRAVASRRVFEMGGLAEVHVHIHRPVGPDAEWEDVETISIADAGVMPENVGYPLLADQIVIVKKDTLATVEGGVYRGLSGGVATVSALADFSKLDDPRLPFVPDVTITATDVPLDPLLFHALPDTRQLGGSLRQMLDELNAAGLMDCTVKLGMNPANEPFFRVDSNLKDAIAHPHAPEGPDRLQLSSVRGNVIITDREITLALSTQATSTDGSAEPAPATLKLSVPISVQFSDLMPLKPPSGHGLSLVATAQQLDASLAVEDLVGIFSPATARNLEDLRARYEPYGIADVTVDIDQPAVGGEFLTTVRASNARAYELAALGGRLGLQSSTGTVTITTSTGPEPVVISTDGLTGTLIFQGEAVGTLSAKGSVTPDWKNIPGTPGLTLSVTDARFESPLTKSAVRELGPRSLAEFLDKAVVEGLYNLDLTLGPPGPNAPPVTGILHPRSLQMSVEKTPVIFGDVTGDVEFAGGDGRLRGVRVAAGDWSASADGAWIAIPNGNTAFQCTLGLNCDGLPKDLLAVLPEELKAVFEDLSFSCAGQAELTEAQLSMTFGDEGKVTAFKNSGRVSIQGGKMDVGATVDRIDGVLDYTVSRTGPDTPPEFEIWALLDRFALSGVTMTNGRVRAASGGAGEILVPLISADCHGGRVAGAATVSAPQSGKRRYEADLQASDVRFASVLSDFQSVAPHDPAQTPLQELADESRGRLDMGVSLAGLANDPASRRGRGTATVGGGRIVNIPLLVPLVRLTNLQVPREEKLDYAYADFYLQGRQLIFNEVSISSRSVSVFGFGMATLPDLNLDLRFESKSRARIPVLTGVFEFLRNELVTVVVSGTLSDPHMGVAPLSGATKALGRMFHGAPTQEQKTLDQIEQRSTQDPSRMMRGHGAVEPR